MHSNAVLCIFWRFFLLGMADSPMHWCARGVQEWSCGWSTLRFSRTVSFRALQEETTLSRGGQTMDFKICYVLGKQGSESWLTVYLESVFSLHAHSMGPSRKRLGSVWKRASWWRVGAAGWVRMAQTRDTEKHMLSEWAEEGHARKSRSGRCLRRVEGRQRSADEPHWLQWRAAHFRHGRAAKRTWDGEGCPVQGCESGCSLRQWSWGTKFTLPCRPFPRNDRVFQVGLSRAEGEQSGCVPAISCKIPRQFNSPLEDWESGPVSAEKFWGKTSRSCLPKLQKAIPCFSSNHCSRLGVFKNNVPVWFFLRIKSQFSSFLFGHGSGGPTSGWQIHVFFPLVRAWIQRNYFWLIGHSS